MLDGVYGALLAHYRKSVQLVSLWSRHYGIKYLINAPHPHRLFKYSVPGDSCTARKVGPSMMPSDWLREARGSKAVSS